MSDSVNVLWSVLGYVVALLAFLAPMAAIGLWLSRRRRFRILFAGGRRGGMSAASPMSPEGMQEAPDSHPRRRG
jgi:hypothetical protein